MLQHEYFKRERLGMAVIKKPVVSHDQNHVPISKVLLAVHYYVLYKCQEIDKTYQPVSLQWNPGRLLVIPLHTTYKNVLL